MTELQQPAAQSLSADTLFVGFTGSLGSGCSFVAKGIAHNLGDNAHYYLVSDSLRKIAADLKIEKPTVPQLQNIGNEERSKRGLSAVVELCLDTVKQDDKQYHFSDNEDTVILIDGIKNEGEVRYLRSFPNFWLMSIHADTDKREKRSVGADEGFRFKTQADFGEADARDQREDVAYGQQVRKCNYLADIIVDNPEDFPAASQYESSAYFNKIVKDYIFPMQAVRKANQRPHERPPSVDEALMTMAYCASKRSSCLKRNVGAVIVRVKRLEGEHFKARRTDAEIQFQLISSGCNEVPPGSEACVFEFGKCYRDHLRETKAAEYKKCPICGQEIPQNLRCAHCDTENPGRRSQCQECQGDLLSDYECSNCHNKIFDKFLGGGEDSTGKLLDKCRALHAEENAIIALSSVNSAGDGELVLYTTTFPCNLCANKIAQAGIKRLVYAEPYTNQESKKVLDAIGVNVQKFQGVKSTAYFRLYA